MKNKIKITFLGAIIQTIIFIISLFYINTLLVIISVIAFMIFLYGAFKIIKYCNKNEY